MKPFIQEQNEIREDYIIQKKSSPTFNFLKSRTLKGLFFVLFFATVVPLLIYYLVVDKGTYDTDDTRTCFINRNYRIQCGDLYNITLEDCDKINCCFDNSTKTCFHYFPSKYYYFQETDQNDYKASLSKTPFGKNLDEKIAVTINDKSEHHLEIILHKPGSSVAAKTLSNKLYNCSISRNPIMYVEVFRNSSDDLLLTTFKGPTIVSEKYWEWSFQLTDEYLFGLGQVLIKVEENSTLTKVVYGNNLDHHTLPVFIANKNGYYHGLIVRHYGPLEVTVLPSLLVSLKSLAGSKITLELFVGPTLKEVIKQLRSEQNIQTNVDFSNLGVHVCREGDTLSLKDILNEFNSSPFDFRYESDCIHENLLMALSKDDTEKDNLISAIADLKNKTKRFMLSLPPQILVNSSIYEKIKNLPVFYQNEKGVYQGKYLDSDVIYPYFGHKSIGEYTETLVSEIKSSLQLDKIDDLILNHNWPSDDSFKMKKTDDFQYLSKNLEEAMSSTLPWNVISDSEIQMVHHNDYGALQVQQMKSLDSSNTSFIMTASRNFDTSTPAIIQNYDISWGTFEEAISIILSNSIFGNYLTSIPVCGSTKNYDKKFHESLCIRWYLMASTAPIFRISSDNPRRDPDSLYSVIATSAAIQAINIRYSLQYYYYTVLNVDQEPLMRPMLYDFPNDNRTFDLVGQYMVGPHILVAHPTVPDKTMLSIYLPESVDVWYEFWSGNAYDLAARNHGAIVLDIVETDWIGFITSGSIIPISLINEEKSSLKLIVALKCNQTDCTANGSLMVESDLFSFSSSETTLQWYINSTNVSSDNKSFELREVSIYHPIISNTIFITNIDLYNNSTVVYSDYKPKPT